MKRKNENLNKNISRLVKLTSDKNKPSDAFTQSLIEDAISELKHTKGQMRGRKDTAMNIKRILAYAAIVLIVAGLSFVLVMPSMRQAKEKASKILSETNLPKYRLQAEHAAKSKPAKIEYTEKSVSGKPVIVAKEMDKLEKPQSIDREKIREKLGIKKDLESLGYVTPSDESTLLAFDNAKKAARPPEGADKYLYWEKKLPSSRLPMAHGGTTPPNGENVDAMFFKNYGVNPFIDTEDDHLSTFATDVDTGSYTVVRRFLHDGHLPPNEAVRVEEFVNFFKYNYPAPQKDDFAVYTEAAPWQFGTSRKNSYLLRIGLKGKQISEQNRKPAILTFVIDISGSMNRENRLGLVKRSLRMLIENLRKDDQIGIAVYGSSGRKVMDHKSLDQKQQIISAIESLHSGGSTNAEEGIRIGYQMAENAYKTGYINRVILCSDGVANVGKTGPDQILEIIKDKADKGITLSAIGFGMGNFNDVLMERLGDKGNGYYVYIDTLTQAKRIFEENLTGTLQVIARDVKVQVDFNTGVVRSYRLIGYENRDVPDDKFRDDKYDGGEIGAGHSVTALYELKLWPDKKGTVATTYVRYKHPETRDVTEFKTSFATDDINKSFDSSTSNFKLASTVTEFAEILRKSYWAKGAKIDTVLQKAQNLSNEFKANTDIIELVDLIAKAKQVTQKPQPKNLDGREKDQIIYLEGQK